MRQLILASASPRRKQILKDRGIKFKISPSNIDEENYEHLSPIEMVKTLSLLKAKKAAEKYPSSVILGADTTVVLGKEALGKPKDLKEAKEMLNKLSNSTHIVYTGFSIIDTSNKTKITSYDKTKVTFRKLSIKEIDDYIKNSEVLDSAGSYAIQERAGEFVKKIEGDYLNVVGLPSKVFEYLEEFGIK